MAWVYIAETVWYFGNWYGRVAKQKICLDVLPFFIVANLNVHADRDGFLVRGQKFDCRRNNCLYHGMGDAHHRSVALAQN